MVKILGRIVDVVRVMLMLLCVGALVGVIALHAAPILLISPPQDVNTEHRLTALEVQMIEVKSTLNDEKLTHIIESTGILTLVSEALMRFFRKKS